MAEILLKIIVLGESGVGKTALLQKYINNTFTEDHKSTIGADFFTKKLDIGRSLVTLQIWDTAGQERFASLGKAFYRGANAAILVFDQSNRASFDKVENWKSQFEEVNDLSESDEDFPFLLISNKCDLEKRAVSLNEADQYAQANKMIFYECSALTGKNIKSAIGKIAEIASTVPSTPLCVLCTSTQSVAQV